jgi:hypothetical protein
VPLEPWHERLASSAPPVPVPVPVPVLVPVPVPVLVPVPVPVLVPSSVLVQGWARAWLRRVAFVACRRRA